MDFLNSQHLTPNDGYIHPFREPGAFSFSAGVHDFDQAEIGGIIIIGGSPRPEGEGEQRDVVLRWLPDARRFAPRDEDRRIEIAPNDFLVFGFGDAATGQPPCAVTIRAGDGGRDDKIVADSRRLGRHDAYSHLFMTPGDYHYRVGRTAGALNVTDHRKLSDEEAAKRAGAPLVVMVGGREVEPARAEIVAGMTVIWAVESGEDIAIIADSDKPIRPIR